MSNPADPPKEPVQSPRRVYELRLGPRGWHIVSDPLEAGRYARMTVAELDALRGAVRVT